MRFVLFCHSLRSCWNHGNAHFLRGVARTLLEQGHELRVLEPADGWSRRNLLAEDPKAEEAFAAAYPMLASTLYQPATLDLDQTLDGADVVLVHEWTDPALIARLAAHRVAGGRYRLLFHDTHHRAVSEEAWLEELPLEGFDGVLAFGEALAAVYRRHGWAEQVWVWHEAADIARFRLFPAISPAADLVWIGNWGDGERAEELQSFLLEPIGALRLEATIYGARYPDHALDAIAEAGASFKGWLPNHRAPSVFARHRATVHVPRRFYTQILPGIPTIRMFEAMACGVPLVAARWEDSEGLFRRGSDYLAVDTPDQMTSALREILEDDALAASLRANGRETILARHTCAHRVAELMKIVSGLGVAHAMAEAV